MCIYIYIIIYTQPSGLRHLNYPIVFHIFGAVALISTMAFQVMATGDAGTAASASTASAGPCSKAFSALRQWKDPKTWPLGTGLGTGDTTEDLEAVKNYGDFKVKIDQNSRVEVLKHHVD